MCVVTSHTWNKIMNLLSFAVELAESLSKIEAGWSAYPQKENPENYSWQRVKHTDGRVIWFNCRKEKWIFSGRSEEGVTCNLSNPDVSMSISKTPDKIAADLYRRLIPEYNKYFAECAKISQAHKEYAAKIDAIRQQVADLLKTQPRRDNHFYVNGWEFEVRSDGIAVEGIIPKDKIPEFLKFIGLQQS